MGRESALKPRHENPVLAEVNFKAHMNPILRQVTTERSLRRGDIEAIEYAFHRLDPDFFQIGDVFTIEGVVVTGSETPFQFKAK